MLIVPAIDLKDGQCVRLVRGELGTERTVAPDPISQALAFEKMGAERLHLVDLDGAFQGHPVNLDIIKAIARSVQIPIEVGGGLRSEDAVDVLMSTGAEFAIIGTMLVEDTPRFRRIADAYPGRIIAGIDTRDRKVVTKGWVGESAVDLYEAGALAVDAGACAIITTDTTRDGTGSGVNVEDTMKLAEKVRVPVLASGGVSGLRDIERLARTAIAGVIVGKALYDGALDFQQAIEASRQVQR